RYPRRTAGSAQQAAGEGPDCLLFNERRRRALAPSNWASWARDLGYDYTTGASPSGGWWLLGVGPRHYPTADRLAHDRPVLLLRQCVAQRAAEQLNGIEAKVPRDFVERIEGQIPLAPLDARDVPRGEFDAMGERLLGEAPVPSLTPEIRA